MGARECSSLSSGQLGCAEWATCWIVDPCGVAVDLGCACAGRRARRWGSKSCYDTTDRPIRARGGSGGTTCCQSRSNSAGAGMPRPWPAQSERSLAESRARQVVRERTSSVHASPWQRRSTCTNDNGCGPAPFWDSRSCVPAAGSGRVAERLAGQRVEIGAWVQLPATHGRRPSGAGSGAGPGSPQRPARDSTRSPPWHSALKSISICQGGGRGLGHVWVNVHGGLSWCSAKPRRRLEAGVAP